MRYATSMLVVSLLLASCRGDGAADDAAAMNMAVASGMLTATNTSFSTQSAAALVSTCRNESANGVYASSTALYVSQAEPGGDSEPFMRIHKFRFTAAVPEYAGSVRVRDDVWTGAMESLARGPL